jgi:WD40 repeat protein
VTSQKVLSKVQAPDQVYCLDVRADGEQYATAGKDKAVRLHDDGTGAVVVTCRPGGYETVGHSNRIFGVKYHPNDPTRLVSGGWDNTVIFWDARTGASTASVFGPHVCGDSVDLYDNLLLTGSWRPEKQLQLWDIRYVRRNEPVCDIPWSAVPAGSGSSAALATRMASRGAPALLYAAQFSASGSYIAAGGSGSNEAKVFDNTGTLVQSGAIPEPTADPPTPSLAPPTLCGTIAGLSRSVYSVSFDGDSAVAVAGGDFLLVFDVSPLAGAAGGAGGPSAFAAEKDGECAFTPSLG